MSGFPRAKVWSLAVIAAALAFGCGDDAYDPLDPELLADLARASGDKAGDEWSGIYRGPATRIDCDCPSVEVGLGGTDESTLIDPCLISIGEVEIDVVHGGGVVATDGAFLLSGAISSEDGVVLAAIADRSEVYGQVHVYERFDGAFSGQPWEATLTGRHQRRFVASLLGDSIDCRVSHDLELKR